MKKILWALLFVSITSYAAVVEFSGVTPTEREDNTPLGLSEIAGFNIYCGATIGDYQESIYIEGATLPDTVWQVDKANGTHYCVVTTVDIDGRESTYSEMVTVVVESKALPKPPTIAPNQVIKITSTLP